jgi:hypothetical protein
VVSTLKNLALVVAATAVGVALVEVGMRVFAGPVRYHATRIGESLHFDPHLGFRELRVSLDDMKPRPAPT